MRKIIFLDIDGVLNTEQYRSQSRKKKAATSDHYGDLFDPEAVNNLRRIIEATGAEIVISSTWKFMGLSKLQDMWAERGLPGVVIGVTPNEMSDEILLNANLSYMELYACRGQEIKEWLSLHGRNVSHYAILDDIEAMMPEQQSHYVQTSPITGISEDDADQIIAMLNK